MKQPACLWKDYEERPVCHRQVWEMRTKKAPHDAFASVMRCFVTERRALFYESKKSRNVLDKQRTRLKNRLALPAATDKM